MSLRDIGERLRTKGQFAWLTVRLRARRGVNWLLLKKEGLFLAFLPAAGIVAAWLLPPTLATQISPPTLGQFFLALGAAILGAMAIAFTVSVFLLQSVADLYSPLHFTEYAYGWKQRLVYGLVAAIVIFDFAVALYLSSLSEQVPNLFRHRWIVFWALGSCGTVFALFQWQYVHVVRRLSPQEAARFLAVRAMKRLSRIHGDVLSVAELLTLQNVPFSAAVASAYQSRAQHVSAVIVPATSGLIEFARRLSMRGDAVAASVSVRSVEAVLRRYLANRKDSSIALPSDVLFAVESDSGRLLGSILEQLNLLGNHFVRSSQPENARATVDVYAGLVSAAAEIRFINQRFDNPILSQLTESLFVFVQESTALNDREVPFRSVGIFESIGRVGVQREISHLVYGASQRIGAIAMLGAAGRAFFLVDSATRAQTALLDLLLTTHHRNLDTCFGEVCRQLFRGHAAAEIAAGGRGVSQNTATTTLRKPFYEIQLLIGRFWERYTEPGRNDLKILRRNFSEFADEFATVLRQVAEEAEPGAPYLDLLPNICCDIAGVLINLKADDPYQHFASGADPDLYLWLPTWIGSKAKAGADRHAIDSSADALAFVCLEWIRDGKSQMAETAHKVVVALAMSALEGPASHGYFEPRLMERACYCGALALKRDELFLLSHLLQAIPKFEEAYRKKYAAPIPTSLKREVWRWRHDREQGRRDVTIRRDPDALASQLLTIGDIDAFIWHVWREISPESPKYDELTAPVRRQLIAQLLAILKARLDSFGAADNHVLATDPDAFQ